MQRLVNASIAALRNAAAANPADSNRAPPNSGINGRLPPNMSSVPSRGIDDYNYNPGLQGSYGSGR